MRLWYARLLLALSFAQEKAIEKVDYRTLVSERHSRDERSYHHPLIGCVRNQSQGQHLFLSRMTAAL